MNSRSKNLGFTMIELMISLGLGLLVGAAATQLFLTNLEGFNLQRGISDVQDNGRFALDYINRDIRQAGVRPMGSFTTNYPPVVVGTGEMPGATAAILTSNSATTTGLGSSDQLLIQRMIVADSVDCEGNKVAFDSTKNTYVVSRYFLRADAASDSTSALACDGGSHDTSTLSNIGDAGVALLGSAENMQVQLGVGAAGVPTQYYRPDQYIALAAPRPRILAVRIGLMVTSTDRTGKQLGAAPVLNVLDAVVNNAPADGRIRRVFVTSIALRNEL